VREVCIEEEVAKVLAGLPKCCLCGRYDTEDRFVRTEHSWICPVPICWQISDDKWRLCFGTDKKELRLEALKRHILSRTLPMRWLPPVARSRCYPFTDKQELR
jgi:hypothetical protein